MLVGIWKGWYLKDSRMDFSMQNVFTVLNIHFIQAHTHIHTYLHYYKYVMFILPALYIHRVRRVNLFLEPLVFGQLDSSSETSLDFEISPAGRPIAGSRHPADVSDGWFL